MDMEMDPGGTWRKAPNCPIHPRRGDAPRWGGIRAREEL